MSDRKISTIESCDDDPVIQKIQDEFLKEGAVQCGYCIPGIVMTVRGLIGEFGKSVITEENLRDHLDGNIYSYKSKPPSKAMASACKPILELTRPLP